MANNPEGGTSVSPFVIGLLCRCPRCGRGKLFSGLLDVAETCTRCELDLSVHDTGDGPAVFVILIVGGLAVTLAFVVETSFAPPIWAHLIYQIPFILGASILCLRPLKATLIALQYRHSVGRFDGRFDG
ncbi:MAG: DUF983 domain-containing protein, partial [Rhodospirillaceae bacterium]|nr:DUF983 domain-containing protein [Rhodospirillaceae bacterium]